MELKESLQHYTESEFLNFVKKIWAVDVRKQDHDKLVNHFDKIVRHPRGADLLFYQEDVDTGVDHSAESVVFDVKNWHKKNGKPAFKGEVLPSPGSGTKKPVVRLSAQEMALKRSSENLTKIQKIAADISSAGQAAEAALSHFALLIGQSQIKQTTPATGAAQQQLADLLRAVSSLESAQHKVVTAVRKLEFLELTVQFAKNGAQRDLSSPFLDRGLQATVLQQMTRSSDQYLAKLSVVRQRHRDLHTRAVSIFDGAQKQLARLFSITGTGPTRTASTFTAPAIAANVRPYFMLTGWPSQTFESLFTGLQKAVRSAVAEFTWQVTSTGEEHPGAYSSVLQFSFNNLVDDKRFGLSVPLAELVQLEGRNWQSLAMAGADVELPLRMCSGTAPAKQGSQFIGLREVEVLSHVLLTPTNGSIVPSRVRVRAALWDQRLAAFSFTTEGSAPATLLWTPTATLANSTDTLMVQTDKPNQIGSISTPRVPLLAPFSVLEEVHFDDYIVVFPTDSGLNPIYIMLKDRREYPGVVSGNGQPVSAGWFNSALAEESAPVPAQIAEQLRGQVFNGFDAFKTAFWKAVAADLQLNAQFDKLNQERIGKGAAPVVETNGRQKPVVIRHKQAISSGGEVYDMDNLSISR